MPCTYSSFVDIKFEETSTPGNVSPNPWLVQNNSHMIFKIESFFLPQKNILLLSITITSSLGSTSSQHADKAVLVWCSRNGPLSVWGPLAGCLYNQTKVTYIPQVHSEKRNKYGNIQGQRLPPEDSCCCVSHCRLDSAVTSVCLLRKNLRLKYWTTGSVFHGAGGFGPLHG